MYIPKVAAINDLSGVGRCSLTTAIPVLSSLGVQCCPMPTAILSCHTGFEKFHFTDFTEHLNGYIDNWKYLNLQFNAVYSGFLGSERQLDIVAGFIHHCKSGLVFIDPVMGDDGAKYTTYTPKMCEGMRDLIRYADIITPNITEACILTDTEYKGDSMSIGEAFSMAESLVKLGTKSAVITGVMLDEDIAAIGCVQGKMLYSKTPRTRVQYSGTGDLFASVLCGCIVRNIPFDHALDMACGFVHAATEFSMELNTPILDGIAFEPLLYKLGGEINAE